MDAGVGLFLESATEVSEGIATSPQRERIIPFPTTQFGFRPTA